MAYKVINWNCVRYFFIFIDFIIFALNGVLFFFMSRLIYKEYYSRSSLNLFITPFLISIINLLIDVFMNKINIIMAYAGHNRYGMIVRFFMFYFVLIIIIYSDQRSQYLSKKGNDEIQFNYWIFLLGLINIGLIVFSMIISFFVIDIQNMNLKRVRKNKKKDNIEEEMNNLRDNIIPDDSIDKK